MLNLDINYGLLWTGVIGASVLTIISWLFDLLSPKHWVKEAKPWKTKVWVSVFSVYLLAWALLGLRASPRPPHGSGELKVEDRNLNVPKYKTVDNLEEGDNLQKSGQDSLDKFRKRLLDKKGN